MSAIFHRDAALLAIAMRQLTFENTDKQLAAVLIEADRAELK